MSALAGQLRAMLLLSAVLAPGCVCTGPVSVQDRFAVAASAEEDSLHTYASHARIALTVRAAREDVDDYVPKVSDGSGFGAAGSATATIENIDEDDDDQLRFDLVTDGPGTVTIEADISGDQALFIRDLTIVDVDALTLAVTAPQWRGIELPAVDAGNVRIFAGGKAALRTTLLAAGTEVFGIAAVTATASDASVTTRQGIGCALDTCEAQRAATEIAVPAAAVAPVDVTLTAGSASIVLHVVPTPPDDVSDVVLEQGDALNDKGVLVAHVLAGTDAVLGAPVTWAVDGEQLVNDDGALVGDTLQFDVGGEPRETVATLEGVTLVTTTIAGQNHTVTSITAACGAAGSEPLATTALVLGLVAVRRRCRRGQKQGVR
jgi:hypothetical protein